MILFAGGLVVVNLAPVSSAYCSVWGYAGHGTPPGYSGCSGGSSSTASASTTTTSSVTSASRTTTNLSLSTISSSSSTTTSNGVLKATLSLASNSFSANSISVDFTLQTTGPVNLTVVGASNYVVYSFCITGLQCVQNDGMLSVTAAGTYPGIISSQALTGTPASTYTSNFEALFDGQIITSVPISAVVGGGTSSYFCTEQSFNINITRALIQSNGQVYSSTPLQSLIGKPGTPTTPIVAYETSINAVPISGASGSFLVTYEVLGTGPISTNFQPIVLTQGSGWKLFEFQKTIPASGGSFNVFLNATDMLWGEYYAGLDANTQSLLSNAGWTGNEIFNLYLIANLSQTGQTNGDDLVIGSVSLQGCNGQSSTLQSFQDYLYIPTATSRTLVTTTSTPVPACLPHQPKTCIQSLVPLNLAPRPGFIVIGNPFGKNAVLNAVGDSLVLAGIAVATGSAVYYLKKD